MVSLRIEKQLEWGHLRCLSGSARAGESSDDAGLDRTLLIAARATSAELGLRIYVLWLAQETSEKNIGCVIVGPPGAYQARKASQMPSIRVLFDATKVAKRHPTRTAKTDDALREN